MRALIISLIYALFMGVLVWDSPEDFGLIVLIGFLELMIVGRFTMVYYRLVHEPHLPLGEINWNKRDPVLPLLHFLLSEVTHGYPKPWVLLWGTIVCQLYLVLVLLITGLPSTWLTLILSVTSFVTFARCIGAELNFGFVRAQE